MFICITYICILIKSCECMKTQKKHDKYENGYLMEKRRINVINYLKMYILFENKF